MPPHPDTVVRIFTALGAQALAAQAGTFLARRTRQGPVAYCLAGHVITLDALHTVRAHAVVICEQLLAHYVMTVNCNTPGLYDALDALDWASVPVQHEVTETGHGRRERRTIQVMDAPEEVRNRFPHLRQAALIERYVTRKARKRKKGSRKHKTTGQHSAVAVFVIPAWTPARPDRNTWPATSAATGASRTRSTGTRCDVP